MSVQLAPLLLVLPTLFVSLNLTILPSFASFPVNILQSSLFASLSVVFILLFFKFLKYNGSEYVSEDSDFLSDYNDHHSLNKLNAYRNFIYLWIPMMSLFLANSYLGPLRVISLIFISQLLNKFNDIYSNDSLKLKDYNESIFSSSYKNFQIYILFIISLALDLSNDIYSSNDYFTSHILGYTFISIPFFINSVMKNKNKNGVYLGIAYINYNIKLHIVIIIFSLLNISYFYFEDYNFNMFAVSTGSLIILICTQFETNRPNKLRIDSVLSEFMNSKLILHYYKSYYIILNFIILSILFLNDNIGPNFNLKNAFEIFISQYSISTLINTFLMIMVYMGNKNINTIINDDILSDKKLDLNEINNDLKENSGLPLLNLFIQLINSKESKSILNFLLLNLAFMFIQLLYSLRSKSLSLLSDSLHMLLDCLSLFLGLMASVVSKYNLQHPSEAYPFGLGRIGALSGFTNGILLLVIVIGIYNESIHRFLNPMKLENTTELLIVSTLGFLVNLVGIFAFNHGHDHSHGHSHSHSFGGSNDDSTHNEHSHECNDDHKHEHKHEHKDEHSHEHSNEHNNEHTHEHNHEHAHNQEHSHGTKCEHNDHSNEKHSDSHDDDNMHGIFLHIMADTLGSVGVIISTIIVKITGWELVDPITSVMIATLILMSSIPLLKSSSSNLLLLLSDQKKQKLSQLLNEITKISGVKSYKVQQFWPKDGKDSKLIGFIHVQHYRTENALQIRKKIDNLIKHSNIIDQCFVQMENEVDECWCRSADDEKYTVF